MYIDYKYGRHHHFFFRTKDSLVYSVLGTEANSMAPSGTSKTMPVLQQPKRQIACSILYRQPKVRLPYTRRIYFFAVGEKFGHAVLTANTGSLICFQKWWLQGFMTVRRPNLLKPEGFERVTSEVFATCAVTCHNVNTVPRCSLREGQRLSTREVFLV